MPPTALRFYESVGLLRSDRGANGYRDYGTDAVERLVFIRGAKQLDLSLPEIAELLEVVENESCSEVRDALRPRLEQRLRDVDDRLAVLGRLRERLSQAAVSAAACPDSGRRCRTECVLAPSGEACAPTSADGR